MELSGDELAGIADQFGALPPAALRQAVQETAFRAGEELDETAANDQIESALESFALLEIEVDGEPYIAPGPASFPTVPSAASALPHVLDVEPIEVPQAALGAGVQRQLKAAAAEVASPSDAQELLEVTYDAEVWVDVDLGPVRERLDAIASEG